MKILATLKLLTTAGLHKTFLKTSNSDQIVFWSEPVLVNLNLVTPNLDQPLEKDIVALT